MTTMTENQTTTTLARGSSMSDIRIVRDYPHPPAKSGARLTDPELIALWAMRPEAFRRSSAALQVRREAEPGWRGFVECEVLEAREPSLLRYSWIGDEKGEPRRSPTRSRRTPEALG